LIISAISLFYTIHHINGSSRRDKVILFSPNNGKIICTTEEFLPYNGRLKMMSTPAHSSGPESLPVSPGDQESVLNFSDRLHYRIDMSISQSSSDNRELGGKTGVVWFLPITLRAVSTMMEAFSHRSKDDQKHAQAVEPEARSLNDICRREFVTRGADGFGPGLLFGPPCIFLESL
jgi:hypothetical protein